VKKGNEKILNAPDGSKVVLTPDSPSMMIFKADSLDITPGVGEPAKKETKQTATDRGSLKWEPWGDDDQFPNNLLKKLGYLGVAQSGLDLNADLHYGVGVEWFKKEYTTEGKIAHKPIAVPEWSSFCDDTNYLITHSDILQSLETFYMAFVEVILTKGEKGYASKIQCLDTSACRLGKKDPKTGKISNVYFVHKIADGNTRDYEEIPLFDPTDPYKHKKFCVVIKYRCFGFPYYAEPNYYATIRNGWADIAIEVPKIIKALYKNMARLKYQIVYPISAIEAQYPYWKTFKLEEQEKIMVEKKQAIDDAITGAENAGVSVITIYDDSTNQPIKIEPIKNYLDSTAELPNNFAANSEILFSMNVDPSILGLGIPGGKSLSGSGSDKRESRENKQKNLKRERLVSLQIPKLLSRYFIKGFPQGLEPMYMDADTSETLDENPTGSKNVVI